MKGQTHGFCHIHIRWWNLLALLISYFHFPHIPDAESCAVELRPDIMPGAVLERPLTIRVPVNLVHERAREIDFLRVRHIERDDGADFRVEGGLIGRGRLLVGRLLGLRG